jgi:hypothetical protein
MTNGTLELYPIQFVEGLNENEEPAIGRFLTWEGTGIAIPYVPSMTYNLNRIEIYGAPKSIHAEQKYPLHLRTDHKDRPSRVSIVSGKLIVPEGDGSQWLEILMEQSIVVLAQRTYWLSFEEHPLPLSIGLTTAGAEVGLRTGIGEHWAPYSLGKHKVMLRFYGRVMPAAVPIVMQEEPDQARSLHRIERCLVKITELLREQKELLDTGVENDQKAASRRKRTRNQSEQ